MRDVAVDKIIGVIDTGVDYTHSDLTANLWTNASGEYGHDFLTGDGDSSDAYGHGTHVAGTIAAVSNNIGVAGVACGSAKVMCLRAADAFGAINLEAAVAALEYAVANGAKVINCSWGGLPFPPMSVYDAIEEARDVGVLVVFAAGNADPHINLDQSPQYPACFELDNIISVASTGAYDELSYFSDYGHNSVDLAVPGGSYNGNDAADILSTFPGYTNRFYESFQTVILPGVGLFQKEGPNNHWGSLQESDNIYVSSDFEQNGNADGSLVTPEYDTVGLRGLSLRFRYRVDDGIPDVSVWFNGQWVSLRSKFHFYLDQDGWYYESIDLKSYRSSNMKIRFRSIDANTQASLAYDLDSVAIKYIGDSYTTAYLNLAGTSMAAPHVTAAAALVWSKYPELDYTGVKARLMQTVDPLSSLTNKCVAGGRLNLYHALCPAHNVTAGTWHETIQAAIDAANNGDQIVVLPGTYRERISFGGKNVVLQGSNPGDPAIVSATILDGQQTGTVVTFSGSETALATLMGLTICNGYITSSQAGGVSCNYAAPTINKCVIRNNHGGNGGAISASAGVINGCTIYDNTANTGGGVSSCTGPISECTIYGNTASDGGGLHQCSTIRKCTITGNHADNNGGGIYSYSGSPMLVENCLIAGNAASTGGGIYNYTTSTTVRNSTIDANNATAGGGVFDCAGSYSNCTMVHNTASNTAGGASSASTSFMNCIFWSNTAGSGNQLSVRADSTTSMFYCDVQNALAGIYLEDLAEVAWDATSFGSDPLFVSAAGTDGNPSTWQDNDYRLRSGSACLDTGGPAYDYSGQTDMDGRPRVFDGNHDGTARADIGSYEYCHSSIRVPQDYNTIQQAINATQWPGDEVIVADGTYAYSGNNNLSFGGKNIIVRSENGPGACTINCAYSRAFYLHEGECSQAVIDGFTITGGTYSGIYCNGSSPTIRNCVIRNCYADSYATIGGGIRCVDSSAIIEDCEIRDNPSPSYTTSGLAIGMQGTGSPTIRRCEILNNGVVEYGSATPSGSVMVYVTGNPRIEDCLFGNNVADTGGAIAVWCGNLTVNNCTFTGNSAKDGSALGTVSKIAPTVKHEAPLYRRP